ncbi:MAG: MFS transporter [Actinobacteria bacterium]|nr:MFS transporter [Actinomycetota bacterium]
MLADPNVRRLALARLISRLGGWAGFFVGMWGKAAYDLQATAGELALLMFALGVASLIGSLIAGVLVDRLDPRRVLLLGEVAFVPAVLAIIPAQSMTSLAVLAPTAWLAHALVVTAVDSMPPFLTDDPDDLARINATIEGAGTAAFIAGPALGGVIVKFWSVSWVFVLDAATSVVALGIIWGIHLRRSADRERGPGLRQLRDGLVYAYGHPSIRLVLLLGMATFVSFGAFGALEPLFFREVLQTGPEAIGWVNGVFGIGLLAGTVTVERMAGRWTSTRAMVVITVLSGFGAALYAGTDDLRVVIAGALLWGGVLGALFPVIRTLLQVYTEPRFIGRVMGALNVHHQVGEMLPLAFAPALATAFGVQPVLAGGGLALSLLALLAWVPAGRVDAAGRPERLVQVEPLHADDAAPVAQGPL